MARIDVYSALKAREHEKHLQRYYSAAVAFNWKEGLEESFAVLIDDHGLLSGWESMLNESMEPRFMNRF